MAEPEHSISEGFAYLFEKGELPADAVMLLGQAALLTGNEAYQRKAASVRVQSGGLDWMDDGAAQLAQEKKLLPPDKPPGGSPLSLGDHMADAKPMSRYDFRTVFTVTGAAFLCRDYPPEQLIEPLQRAANISHGYVVAHQLWGVETMRRLRCIEGRDAAVLSRKLAEALAAEAGPQPLSKDLHFERLAILSYAGAAPQMASAFIPLLLDAQNDDGSWGDPEVIEHEFGTQRIPREHASALALYALVAMHEVD